MIATINRTSSITATAAYGKRGAEGMATIPPVGWVLSTCAVGGIKAGERGIGIGEEMDST